MLLDSLGAGDRKIALDFLPERTSEPAGLNRQAAFESVAQAKTVELGERVSLALAGARLFGWQRAMECFKQLIRADFDYEKIREQDRA
jgi:hypothetical protein